MRCSYSSRLLVNSYKVKKSAENVDWELVCSKNANIWENLRSCCLVQRKREK